MFSDSIKREILLCFPGIRKTGHKGWYSTNCPYCNKKDHLGINLERTGSFNCFKCEEKGTLYKLLKFIGKAYIIKGHATVNIFQKIESHIKTEEIYFYKKVENKIINPPIGFKRVFNNNYLLSRNVSTESMYMNTWGVNSLLDSLRDYVTVLLKSADGNCIGYVSRITLKSDEIEIIENSSGKKVKRYLNSESDFDCILYGINNVNEGDIVICVEGIFDSENVNTELDLYDKDSTLKTVCSFGKKISDEQISLLIDKKISALIFMYDPDAIDAVKQYANRYSICFPIFVCLLNDKDPGEMKVEEIISVMENAKQPIVFSNSFVNKNRLKVK